MVQRNSPSVKMPLHNSPTAGTLKQSTSVRLAGAPARHLTRAATGLNTDSKDTGKSDMYTGGVFTSNNNRAESEIAMSALQNGSANNSLKRRHRVSRQDIPTGEFLSRAIMGLIPCNVSNNSSNIFAIDRDTKAFYVDNFEQEADAFEQRRSSPPDTEYTDFDPFTNPRGDVEPQESPRRAFDFSRYESIPSPTSGAVFGLRESSELCGTSLQSGEDSVLQNKASDYVYGDVDDDVYESMFTRKYNVNNSWGGDANNNYPNYDEIYNSSRKKQGEEVAKQQQMEQERQRRLREQSMSYTGCRNPSGWEDDTPCSAPPTRNPSQFEHQQQQPQAFSPFQHTYVPLEPEYDYAPACYGFGGSPPVEPVQVAQVQQQQPQHRPQVRPMLMKLGAITVRNNVENDNHYAANINMDLKGGPGAHPVPLDDKMPREMAAAASPMGEAHDASKRRWDMGEDDSYASVYSSDRSYNSGNILSNWRDGSKSVVRENWRGEDRGTSQHKRPMSPVAAERLKPSFSTDSPSTQQTIHQHVTSHLQRRR